MWCVLCLVGVLQLSSSGMSLSFMSESQDKATDTVSVRVVHSAHTREKRSTMQHPDILHLRFDFRGSEVQMNLTQKIRPVPNIPLYANDGRNKVLQQDLPDNEEFAVFRDQLKGAVLVVEIVSESHFNVAGNFHHENKLYKIWPQKHRIHKRTTDLEPNHNIHPIEKTPDMTNDVLSFEDLPEELREKMSAASEKEDPAFENANVTDVARYIIEIGVFPDFAVYSFFLREANFNSTQALANLRTYYSFLEDSLQLRYDSVNLQDPSIAITCWIKFIQVAETPEAAPWIEPLRNGTKVDAFRALVSFILEYIVPGNAIDTADHYMSFTGYDMQRNGNNNTIGLAFTGGLCRSLGVSITEQFIFGFTDCIAAHELAHSLNSSHDGEKAGINCNVSARLIMSSTRQLPDLAFPSSQWFFSTCTIEQFKMFLRSQFGSCTTETTITRGISTGQNEGQVLNADAQCAREVGSGSVFCRRDYPNGVYGLCQIVFCTGTNGNQSTCPGFRVTADRTSCGNGEWCEKGVCVPNVAAPARAENCPQGDEAGANCRRSDCNTLTGFDLIRCCRTCAPFEPTVSIERFVIPVPFG